MILLDISDPWTWIAAVEKSEMFVAARETFYAIPFWIRAAIFCFVLVAAVLSKWILPAWANLSRARRGQ